MKNTMNKNKNWGTRRANGFLLAQLWNERRSNAALFVEMLLVSVILCVLVYCAYVNLSVFFEPMGFDIQNCYRLQMSKVTPEAPSYVAPAASDSAAHAATMSGSSSDAPEAADVAEILTRLQHRPDVEAACLADCSYPYSMNNSYNSCFTDTIHCQGSNSIQCLTASPDFLRVFRYRGMNGETPEQLTQMLRPGTMMATDNIMSDHHMSLSRFIGKPFVVGTDSVHPYRMVASIAPVKHAEYMRADESPCLFIGVPPSDYRATASLVVRVKADQDKGFEQRLRADLERQYHVGNVYVSNVIPYSADRDLVISETLSDARLVAIGVCFLLINVFLGLLGTFWLRTQHRRAEIGLQKVLGATNADIVCRLFAEGVLLLAIAFVPAIVICLNLAYSGVLLPVGSFEGSQIFISFVITFLLMTLIIALGVWFPARRAVAVQPIEALHEE
jgi:putative ABC transport system permease protein